MRRFPIRSRLRLEDSYAVFRLRNRPPKYPNHTVCYILAARQGDQWHFIFVEIGRASNGRVTRVGRFSWPRQRELDCRFDPALQHFLLTVVF